MDILFTHSAVTVAQVNSYDWRRWAGMNYLSTRSQELNTRIHESSAAATQTAAHQLATSKHFEAEPL